MFDIDIALLLVSLILIPEMRWQAGHGQSGKDQYDAIDRRRVRDLGCEPKGFSLQHQLAAVCNIVTSATLSGAHAPALSLQFNISWLAGLG